MKRPADSSCGTKRGLLHEAHFSQSRGFTKELHKFISQTKQIQQMIGVATYLKAMESKKASDATISLDMIVNGCLKLYNIVYANIVVNLILN